ncbi:MAG TPA: cytochrome c [Anaerolineae bacterium]|nr:cytochrome c [Anaerolineae bacterium]
MRWLWFCLLSGWLLVGCGGSERAVVSERDEGVVAEATEAMDKGELVYLTYCAECHGVNLEGEANWQERNEDGSFRAPPHDETGHTWHHPDSYLEESILLGGERIDSSLGVSKMPAYEGVLSEEEVAAVIDYIKRQWSDDIRAMQAARN